MNCALSVLFSIALLLLGGGVGVGVSPAAAAAPKNGGCDDGDECFVLMSDGDPFGRLEQEELNIIGSCLKGFTPRESAEMYIPNAPGGGGEEEEGTQLRRTRDIRRLIGDDYEGLIDIDLGDVLNWLTTLCRKCPCHPECLPGTVCKKGKCVNGDRVRELGQTLAKKAARAEKNAATAKKKAAETTPALAEAGPEEYFDDPETEGMVDDCIKSMSEQYLGKKLRNVVMRKCKKVLK